VQPPCKARSGKWGMGAWLGQDMGSTSPLEPSHAPDTGSTRAFTAQG
jgi:hypothetical protein